MHKLLDILGATVIASFILSCNMNNPLLKESELPFGAPEFDKIKTSHYLPAFEQAIKEYKAEIDAIASLDSEPDFDNTILALEQSGKLMDKVSGIFFNLNEADTNDQMQDIAETVSPSLTELSMYIFQNQTLFERVKQVYEKMDSLCPDSDQKRLTENMYKGFIRCGANLDEAGKERFSKINEELSLLELQFGKNVLAATNAYRLHITDSASLAGLPAYVVEMGKAAADEKGLDGWVYDLSYPLYGPFIKFSTRRDLREQIWRAYNSKSVGGENDNTENVRKIVALRTEMANLLGYSTYAEYAIEERMAKTPGNVENFLEELLEPSLPAAREEIATITAFARENGFEDEALMPWDFSFWSEKYKNATYSISEEQLKPYFKLEDCINAVFDLAGRLYGLKFIPRDDIPGYHKDVKVYEVLAEDGSHLALFYADFFPRESKRGGAWMTEFRGQHFENGIDCRPFISIVTNFTKPTPETPSLLTHSEFTTFLHEFGHALHGMLSRGRYGSLSGTNVSRDFVELPSQIMENWGYEPEYLDTFAKHYITGETIPAELIDKIVESKNYLAAYGQVRQLNFGIIDMAWHTLTALPEESTIDFENQVLERCAVLPQIEGTAISPAFNHIFSGGYSAGYYSYKWAEVLEADAFSLFKLKGIFNREAADAFRTNILEKGSSEDEAVLYRNFRGHDPQPEALLDKLGIRRK